VRKVWTPHSGTCRWILLLPHNQFSRSPSKVELLYGALKKILLGLSLILRCLLLLSSHFVGAATLALRVTHIGIYGRVSTPETTTAVSSQSTIVLEDAYTGRQVRGISTPVKRARAGIQLSELRRMRWYDAGNIGTISEQDLAYFRVTDTSSCFDFSTGATGYDIVVRGFARLSRNIGTCS